jgi:hypothetical protein
VALKEASRCTRDVVPDLPFVARVRIAATVVMSARDRKQLSVCSLCNALSASALWYSGLYRHKQLRRRIELLSQQ